MKILLNECLPRQLRRELPNHDVTTVAAMGSAGTKNGALLRLAGDAAFDMLITIDGNMEYPQHLRMLNMTVVLLAAPDNRLATVRPLMADLLAILTRIHAGDVVRVGT
jgi:predicted nuclease of predicted toxin-antitoxin system